MARATTSTAPPGAYPRRRRAQVAAVSLVMVLSQGLPSPALAELPVEQLTMAKLPPIDANRIYLGDPTMPHLVDGRTHVIDGATMRYLGMLGTGFAGETTLSRDRQTVFVATAYHSRLQRGTRTEVVEAYRADDLTLL